ncbi:MAG: helix-turn-helix domain-containing protein [Janthinobacterium lividum]
MNDQSREAHLGASSLTDAGTPASSVEEPGQSTSTAPGASDALPSVAAVEPASVAPAAGSGAATAPLIPAARAPLDSDAAIGAALMAARSQKGWSIEEVASRLKVAAAKLRALESGKLETLSDATFLTGLVRSYAKALDLDPQPLVEALRRVRGTASPELKAPLQTRGSALNRSQVPLSLGNTRRTGGRSWLWAIAAVVVVVAALAVWRAGNEPNGWLTRLKAGVPDAASSTRGTSGASSVSGASGIANPDSASGTVTVPLRPPAGTGDQAGGAQAPEAAVAGSGGDAAGAQQVVRAQQATLAAVSAASGLGPATRGIAVTEAAPVGAASTGAAAAPAAAGASTLSIDASASTWISVRQQDGKEVFSGTLAAGQSRQVQGMRPFKLVVGNVGGIAAMTQDGRPVDLGQFNRAPGQVAHFELP